MSSREAERFAALRRVVEGDLVQAQAAKLLDVSVRQVKRLCRRVLEEGPAGLISRRRCRPSNRRIDDAERKRYEALVRERYADFGPQVAHGYLQRERGVRFSVETLCRWRIRAGLWSAKRRRAPPV